MLAAERLSKIKEFMLEYKHADVNTLSVMLSVSEATIRKDLEKLEQQNFVQRFHGGAVLIEQAEEAEPYYFTSDDPFISEKQQIADICNRLIQPNDIIFLGPGSTCFNIARELKKEAKKLTVITNNIHVLNELYNNISITVISTGGIATGTNGQAYLGGPLSLTLLDQLLISKVFITVDGIHLKYGFTVSSPEILDLYQKLLKKADELFVVTDSSKFDKVSMLPFAPINGIYKIVASENIPDTYKELFFNSNITLFTTIAGTMYETDNGIKYL